MASETTPSEIPEDPFADLSKLVMSQDFERQAGVEKLITVVPIRKPKRHEFIRVHPDPDFRMSPAGIIDLKEEREQYLVLPHLAAELLGEFKYMTLHLAVTRQGVSFIWPVPLPDSDGRRMVWNESAAEAAQIAMRSWVRVSANMQLGAYEVTRAPSMAVEPTWPEMSFQDLLRIAFRGYVIGSVDHPVVRRLRGLE